MKVSAADLAGMYAGSGLHLIATLGKRPLGDDWPRIPERRRADSVSEQAVFEELAEHLARDSRATVGWVVPNSVVVLDVDSIEGRGELEEAIPLGTPFQVTPRGAHAVFRVPSDAQVKNAVGVDLGPGLVVDVRTAGGQIIVWPSQRDGKRYAWMSCLPQRREELPFLPKAWLARLRTPPERWASPSPLVSGPIRQGCRNRELFVRACRMQRAGLSDAAIRVGIHAENRTACNPPLSETEVDQLLDSALSRYPKGACA